MGTSIKLLVLSAMVLSLSHCSEEPDIQIDGVEAVEKVEFAMAKINLADVCDDVIVQTQTGNALKGKKNCKPLTMPKCSLGIKESCILDYEADHELTLVQTAKLQPEHIKGGVTIGNVEGTMQPEGDFHYCQADGDEDCIVSGSYAAVATANLAAKVVAGNIVGGVAGRYDPVIPKPLCQTEGQVGCVTTPQYKAFDASTIPAGKLSSDTAIAGVQGTLAGCAADGGTGCIANANFKAADMSRVRATAIRSGITIAGQAGSLATYSDCARDGAMGCIATRAFKAVNISAFTASDIKAGTTIAGISGSLAQCAADGVDGCVTTAAYRPVDMAKIIPGNIRSGVTLAGVRGTVSTYPLCLRDGAIDCVTTSTYPAARRADFRPRDIRRGKTIAGVIGELDTCTGDAEEGCITTAAFKAADMAGFSSSDIKSSATIAGVGGSLADCNSDGQNSSCVIAAGYTAVQTTKLKEGAIKSGYMLGGVTGKYPSATYPLPGFGRSDRVLTGATFDEAISQTDLSYEFWDHRGVKHAASTTSALVPGNIKSGVTLFGVTGAMVASSGAPDTWDIRKGITINGVTGSIPTDCGGVACNVGAFEDVSKTSEGPTTCPREDPEPAGKDCMYKDRITGLIWTDYRTSVGVTRNNAVNKCIELNSGSFGGYSDWRVPSIVELTAFFSHGIGYFDSRYERNFHRVWSSTYSDPSSTTFVNFSTVSLGTISVDKGNSTALARAICVRSP